jgi:hypothetical protein
MSQKYEKAQHELKAAWVSSPMSAEEAANFFNPSLEIDEEIWQNILVYRCSNCKVAGTRTPYCPNCGAIMACENDEETISL